jgi:uncharacterized protein
MGALLGKLRIWNLVQPIAIVAMLLTAAFLITSHDVSNASRDDDVCNNPGDSLLLAARDGDVNRLQAALRDGANVNTAETSGRTALIFAAEEGHDLCCKILLDQGARLDARTNFGWTALMLATLQRHEPVVRLLISRGADVNQRSSTGATALLIAARTGDRAIFHDLLAAGADVHAVDRNGCTALSFAAQSNFGAPLVTDLLDMGFDPNQPDHDGQTPLMEAAAADNQRTVQVLLAHGAKLNPKNRDRQTAMDHAKETHDDGMVAMLQARGGA